MTNLNDQSSAGTQRHPEIVKRNRCNILEPSRDGIQDPKQNFCGDAFTPCNSRDPEEESKIPQDTPVSKDSNNRERKKVRPEDQDATGKTRSFGNEHAVVGGPKVEVISEAPGNSSTGAERETWSIEARGQCASIRKNAVKDRRSARLVNNPAVREGPDQMVEGRGRFGEGRKVVS